MQRLLLLSLFALPAAFAPDAHADTCKTGKPCGNTCIARDKVCRVGSGSSTYSPPSSASPSRPKTSAALPEPAASKPKQTTTYILADFDPTALKVKLHAPHYTDVVYVCAQVTACDYPAKGTSVQADMDLAGDTVTWAPVIEYALGHRYFSCTLTNCEVDVSGMLAK